MLVRKLFAAGKAKSFFFATMAALGALSAKAQAQSPVVGITNWTFGVNGFVAQGTGTQTRTGVVSGGTTSAGWVQITGSANQDGDAIPDTFRPSIQESQTIQTNAVTNFYIPNFLVGQMTFAGGGAANWATASFFNNSSVQLINTLTNAVVATMALNQAGSGQTGNVNVNQFNMLVANNVPAGTYTLNLNLGISGNADGTAPNISANGSSVSVDFGTGANGLIGSMAVIPAAGIGDSRAAVNAPLARANYGVDGSGVQVAVIEPGSVDSTSVDLQNAAATDSRVSYVYPAGGLGAGVTAQSVYSEHALAVAGVIAGSRGNNSQNGIAPNASIISVPLSPLPGNGSQEFQAGVANLLLAYPNLNVINMSATTGNANVAGDNTFINNICATNQNLTFVEAAGNTANTNVMAPAGAANTISVGALNNNFNALASFSSYGTGGNLQKPDIVAPGQYITSAIENAVAGSNYGNFFEGTDYHNFNNGNGANTGAISGTSFASPMVAGATALLNQYGKNNFNADPAKVNNLVMKAVLLNGASIYIPGTRNRLLENDGVTGWNQGVSGNTTPTNPTIVTRSLDPQLGAGILDVNQSLKQYASGDVQVSNNNTQQQEIIPAYTQIQTAGGFWDLEQVQPNNGAVDGTVDYLLGDVSTGHLRATLTWNVIGGVMPDLQIQLYHEVPDDGGGPNPALDALLAQTTDVGDNVKLLDIDLPPYPVGNGNPEYYLQVDDPSATTAAWTYGLAVFVPEPGTALMVTLCLGATLCRRRQGNCPMA